MTAFRFRLETVLSWRRSQLEAEERKYKRELALLVELARLQAEVCEAGARAELQVREWSSVTGEDLAALAAFRNAIELQKKTLTMRRAQQAARTDAQQAALMEARRRCRLLERLKERRFEEWRAAEKRALEELASESFLARFARQRTGSAHGQASSTGGDSSGSGQYSDP